jgi:hypothetical protein
MNPYGYTKLYHSIFGSSVWSETPATRCVFLTLLGNVDYQTGRVILSFPGLVRLANVSYEECKEAMRILEAPDIHSKSPEWGGRRIEKVDGGWLILNYLKYRDMQTPSQSAAAERQRRFRDRRGAEHAWLKEHPGQPLPEPFPEELVERYVTLRNARERANKDVDLNPDVDLHQNQAEEGDRPAVVAVAKFLETHDFGRWAGIVEGYLRASKKPINVMAELELWLTGEMGRKRQTAEIVGYALNQYAASGKAEGFVPNLFSGFVRSAIRGIERQATAQSNDHETAYLVQERRDREEREREEAERKMLVDFEIRQTERFAELQAQAEASIDAKYTGDTRAGMVRSALVLLVRKEGRR